MMPGMVEILGGGVLPRFIYDWTMRYDAALKTEP